MKIFLSFLLVFVSCFLTGQTVVFKSEQPYPIPSVDDYNTLQYCNCDSVMKKFRKYAEEYCDTIPILKQKHPGYWWNFKNKNGLTVKCGYFENNKFKFGLAYTYNKPTGRIRIGQYFNGNSVGERIQNEDLPMPGEKSYVMDSLFIERVKKFSFKEFGKSLAGDFYTKWKANENPYYVVFASEAAKVKNAAANKAT